MSSQIRMQADDFFHAYRVLKESNDAAFGTIEKFDGDSKVSDAAFGGFPAMGPSVVCLAFSVELYMKDLHLALTGKAPRGHNILKLYRKLPKKIRREIFYHETISQNPWATRGTIFFRKRFSGNCGAYYSFLLQVKAISDGFENWRYSYERRTIRYEEWFALSYIETLKTVADSNRSSSAA